jgi:hypothetical protein
MATITTTNAATSPMTLLGQVGKLITRGGGVSLDYIINVPVVYTDIFPVGTYVNQILGLVPLGPCTSNECRTYTESDYINTVFGHLTDADVYFNDTNTFMFSFDGYLSGIYTTTMKIQEEVGGVWTDLVTLTDNTYGTYIPYSTYASQPSYAGFIIAWRNILNVYGEGVYRFKVTITGGHANSCAVSEPFCLKTWTCTDAMNTVKFEITLTNGTIGHASNPAILVNLCSITYTDSIRFEGFFGYEKAEYERKNVEYNNGIIYKVRDEVIKKFDLQTGRLPKWVHDRFKAYALMADTLFVSDYNYNNPDYDLKRKGVVCDSGYEPVWVQNSRYARVKVSFKENQQNLIRRRCCDARK